MPLKKIRLELARDPGFPAGSPNHGYEFVAPLDANARIDASEWQNQRDRCRVVRFWGTDEREHGQLKRRTDGSWGFHYEREGDIDIADETGFRFGDHAFRRGEYVSIREADGQLRTFTVAQVTEVEQ